MHLVWTHFLGQDPENGPGLGNSISPVIIPGLRSYDSRQELELNMVSFLVVLSFIMSFQTNLH